MELQSVLRVLQYVFLGCFPASMQLSLRYGRGFVLLTLVLIVPTRGVSIWSVGKPAGHVEIRDDLPTPAEFFRNYIQNEGGPFEGIGKPVLFRGAAKKMPAYSLWTDEYLKERHGKTIMDQVETEKKETRTALPHENWSLAKFLSHYNKTQIYSTAVTPAGLDKEVYLLPFMNCGGFAKRLSETVLWFSSGSTKSVIHNDAHHNIHCMFAGSKDWIVWRSTEKIATRGMGWIDGEQEAKRDPNFKDAYGAYGGKIDVDNVDLERFPGWDQLTWWKITVSSGDCVYLPPRWFHFVEAPPQRTLSVHVWFGAAREFESKSCDTLERRGYDASDYLIRLGDCKFGYDERQKKKSKCKIPNATAKRDSAEL